MAHVRGFLTRVLATSPVSRRMSTGIESTTVYDFKAMNIDGEAMDLKEFRNKYHVMLIVNVASN